MKDGIALSWSQNAKTSNFFPTLNDMLVKTRSRMTTAIAFSR